MEQYATLFLLICCLGLVIWLTTHPYSAYYNDNGIPQWFMDKANDGRVTSEDYKRLEKDLLCSPNWEVRRAAWDNVR